MNDTTKAVIAAAALAVGGAVGGAVVMKVIDSPPAPTMQSSPPGQPDLVPCSSTGQMVPAGTCPDPGGG